MGHNKLLAYKYALKNYNRIYNGRNVRLSEEDKTITCTFDNIFITMTKQK